MNPEQVAERKRRIAELSLDFPYTRRANVSLILLASTYSARVHELIERTRQTGAEELIVCVDGSSADSPEALAKQLVRRNDFLLRSNDQHLTRTIERAIHLASAPMVCLLRDEDRLPVDGAWFRGALALFDAIPSLAIVSGNRGWLDRPFGARGPGGGSPIPYRSPVTAERFMYVAEAYAGPFFIRRAFYDATGGLDPAEAAAVDGGENFGAGLCHRAWQAGWRVGLMEGSSGINFPVAVTRTGSEPGPTSAQARELNQSTLIPAPHEEFAVHGDVVAWRDWAILILEDPGGGSELRDELARRGATSVASGSARIDESGKVCIDGSPGMDLALLIVTRHAPGVAWAPVTLTGARATLPLLTRMPAFQRAPRRALMYAARLGTRLVTLRGAYPDAGAAAPTVLEFVDRLLEGASPAAAPAELARTESPGLPDVLANAAWVPIAVTPKTDTIRFRRFARPFHIAHARANPRPWDVELSLCELESAAAAMQEPARVVYVYHHGYAGSTLLFRLLDVPGVSLCYDEPNVHFHHYASPAIRKLCYRTIRPTETPIVKTLPAELRNARRHFADHAEARALFFYAPLEEYVAATLRYPYRCEYVKNMAKRVLKIDCADPSEAAVVCWNAMTEEALALAPNHAIRMLDAQTFFADPASCLPRIWAWFGLAPQADWGERLVRVGATHAKDPRRPFSTQDRDRQNRVYALHAQSWLAARQAEIAAARETLTRLVNFAV